METNYYLEKEKSNIKRMRARFSLTRIIVSFIKVLVNLKCTSSLTTDIYYASDYTQAQRGGPKRAEQYQLSDKAANLSIMSNALPVPITTQEIGSWARYTSIPILLESIWSRP